MSHESSSTPVPPLPVPNHPETAAASANSASSLFIPFLSVMRGSSTENQGWPRPGDGDRSAPGSRGQPGLGGGHGSAAGAVGCGRWGRCLGVARGLCLVATFLSFVLELIRRLRRDKNRGLAALPAPCGTQGTRSPPPRQLVAPSTVARCCDRGWVGACASGGALPGPARGHSDSGDSPRWAQ